MIPNLASSLAPSLAQIGERVWMPDAASSYAADVDGVFYLTYWASVIAFVVIVSATIFMVVKYRARPGHKEQPSPAHSTALELT